MNNPLPQSTAVCARVLPDLKAYADNELGLIRRAFVHKHLARCPACSRELETVKELTAMLQTDEPTQATSLSPALRDRLVAIASDAPVVPPTMPIPIWRRSPLLTYGAGGGLLAASAAAWFSLYNNAVQKNTVESTANQKQSGVALGMYRQDYDENFPQLASGKTAVTAATEAQANDKLDVSNTLPTAANGRIAMASAGGSRSRIVGRVPGTLGKRIGGEGYSAADALVGSTLGQGRPWLVGQVTEAAKTAPRTIYASGARPVAAAAPPIPLEARGRALVVQVPRRAPSLNTERQMSDVNDSALIDERKVRREASIGVSVERLEEASNKVEEMTQVAGGYVASNNLETDNDGYKSATLSLRVPTERFDQTLNDVSKLGEVVSKQIVGEDITERVSDTTSDEQVLVDDVRQAEARLKDGGMSEKRTGQKEAELRQIRMQLARTRARLGLLRRMATLATIDVSLSTKPKKVAPAAPKTGVWNDLRETNRSAAMAFQAAIRVPLVLCVWVLAFSPLWVPLVFALRYLSLKNAAQAAVVPAQPEPDPETR